VVDGFDEREDLTDELAAGRPGAPMDEFLLERCEELSATALSWAQPLEPIETAMPASRAFWPKPSATYCDLWSEW